MAGSDHRLRSAAGGPVIVLVEPQMGENIGAACRAMLNCGLTRLRLVAPRDGWPNPKAVAMASGAAPVLDNVRVFGSTSEAVADLNFILAATVRPREMIKPVFTPCAAAVELRARDAKGQATGILFGSERSGLVNDDIALADAVLTVPLNPGFASLNLAQGVLLTAYEWFKAGQQLGQPDFELRMGDTFPATKADILNLTGRLETALEDGGYFASPDMRPHVMRNITSMFQRMQITEQEVKTFHGIVSAIWRAKGKDSLTLRVDSK